MLFKRSKKEIPSELPDLTFSTENEPLAQKVQIRQSTSKPKILYDSNEEPEILMDQNKNEEGFFKEVMGNFVDESANVEKMESFYNNRFMTEDIVHQMRSYWENKKPELMLKNVGKDLKEKIANKTEKLHRLEHDWQDIYFALMTKEEEIRNEEKELKETLSEFMNVCKKFSKKRKN